MTLEAAMTPGQLSSAVIPAAYKRRHHTLAPFSAGTLVDTHTLNVDGVGSQGLSSVSLAGSRNQARI